MNVLDRLDQARATVNVLEHPFYQRWSAGDLSAEELAGYAGEYRRAVVALADASALAAAKADVSHAPGLRRHAEEEAAHVALWDEFARATAARAGAGGSDGVDGVDDGHAALAEGAALAETDSCVLAWTAGEDLLEHLAVLYAIEASQPEISRTKIDGLIGHYGYSEEGPAVEYFRLHETRDVEHARHARELIEKLMAGVDDAEEQADRMVVRARAALEGNWRLLDGVEAVGARG